MLECSICQYIEMEYISKSNDSGFTLPASFLPNLRTNHSSYMSTQQSRAVKQPKPTIPQIVRSSPPSQESKMLLDQSIDSVNQLIYDLPRILQKNVKAQKRKTLDCQERSKECTLEQAEHIWRNQGKQRQERTQACKYIAQSYMKKAFGSELPKLEAENGSKPAKTKNKLNTKILAQILNEIQHNSRSQSILMRKSELEELQSEYFRPKETQKGSRFKNININSLEQRFQLLYKLKNQYNFLKELIITTKSQEYDDFIALMNNQAANELRQTVKTSRGALLTKKTILLPSLQKENKQPKDPYSTKTIQESSPPKSKRPNPLLSKSKTFQNSSDKLIIQNCGEIDPKIFLYMMSHIHFEGLKTVKLRYLWLESDLTYFFLDCMRGMNSSSNCMQYFQCSSIKIQNIPKFGDKLATILSFLQIKTIKLESLELTNRQISKIAESLQQNHICQHISFRHNKIDILGIRYIETLTRKNSNIKFIDLRNNQIPHYANLKDKIKVIQFF